MIVSNVNLDIGHYISAGPHQLTECEKCPPGKFAQNYRHASCDDCPSGFYSNEGANLCNVCLQGYRCPGGVNQIACPPGSFSGSGASSCELCAPGSFTPFIGSISCQSCISGTYSVEGATTCVACQLGFYCPGATDKIPCPDGMISEEGAISCQQSGKY